MSGNETIRVVLIDDHPTIRAGVRSLLELAGGFEVLGEASDGASAVELVSRVRPDVVVMDLRLPGRSGIEATRLITRDDPDLAVLILTMVDDDASIYAAIRAGARGYLRKEAGQDELVRAVTAVAQGEFITSPGVAGRVAAFFSGLPTDRPPSLPGLTEREHEVLDLIAGGWNNQAIAHRLFLSPKTVRNNVSSIFSKLQVADRAQAIIKAREAGLGAAGPEDAP